ncbi:cysteine proteinase inhibitor 5-like [Gossypium australe]|uniref:Cysteine proteinase inhibitor 5-like n=1 Tax=Gossypium australe TaxID=47621 RepID=A0A5B6V6P3_9ROSI|nr:cysteine proteinase inhibitor 5-like [Gossypium australe]
MSFQIHQIYNLRPKPTKNRNSRLKIQLNSCFLILSLSYLFLPFILSDARKDALIEGWTPIKNIKDPHVTKIIEFTVDEHNTQLKGSLKLEELVKGET